MSEKPYQTPRTTDQAFRFGMRSAESGHKRMSREEFLSASEEEHPFPSSLWRAYRHGYKRGQDKKRAQEESQ